MTDIPRDTLLQIIREITKPIGVAANNRVISGSVGPLYDAGFADGCKSILDNRVIVLAVFYGGFNRNGFYVEGFNITDNFYDKEEQAIRSVKRFINRIIANSEKERAK